MSQGTLMIYGATGYTGKLVTAEALDAGLQPVLAGRNADKLQSMARSSGLETRAVALGDVNRLAGAMQDVTAVLNCAGPFSHTALPVFEACLQTGAHYLDITGEISVFATLRARDREAREAQIMVLPGAGFDVVPSDCLIADLARRHPGGRIVRLGLATQSGVSRGTARTVLQNLNNFQIRRDGEIVRVPAGSLRYEFDFGEPPRAALVTALGDVATVYQSTSIANVETYHQATRPVRRMMQMSRWMGGLVTRKISQRVLNVAISRGPPGPTDAERRESYAVLVAEIENAIGGRSAARMRVPDPYGFTAKTAVAIAAQTLRGHLKVGYQTPSLAYGADFIRQFDDVEWEILGG